MSEIKLIHPFQFRMQRLQNWFFLGVVYYFFYLGRYNFSAAQVTIAQHFGGSYSAYSTILEMGLLTYGCAIFVNGPIVDVIGGKRALQIGLAGAAIFNLLFGLGYLFVLKPAVVLESMIQTPAQLIDGVKESTVIATFAVLWACNHYFQSFAALTITKINSTWFHIGERGRFAGILGIMIQGGRMLAYTLLPLSLQYYPWQYAFWLPASFLGTAWIASFWLVKQTPEEAGFTALDIDDIQQQETNIKISLASILKNTFARSEAWLFAVTHLCIGMVRHSVDHWYPRYIVTVFSQSAQGLSNYAPYQVASVSMPIGAVLGGLCAGYASDRLFGSRRAPVLFLALTGQAASLLLLRGCIRNEWGATMSLFLLAFFVHGAHSTGFVAAMDIGMRRSTATAVGFFDGAQYLGGALAGSAMARVLAHYRKSDSPGSEYDVWPLVPLVFAILGALIASRLWNWQPPRHHLQR